MNLKHNALKKTDPNSVQIKDIAHKFGFWHLGPEYKNIFHELPSEPIKKKY